VPHLRLTQAALLPTGGRGAAGGNELADASAARSLCCSGGLRAALLPIPRYPLRLFC